MIDRERRGPQPKIIEVEVRDIEETPEEAHVRKVLEKCFTAFQESLSFELQLGLDDMTRRKTAQDVRGKWLEATLFAAGITYDEWVSYETSAHDHGVENAQLPKRDMKRRSW